MHFTKVFHSPIHTHTHTHSSTNGAAQPPWERFRVQCLAQGQLRHIGHPNPKNKTNKQIKIQTPNTFVMNSMIASASPEARDFNYQDDKWDLQGHDNEASPTRTHTVHFWPGHARQEVKDWFCCCGFWPPSTCLGPSGDKRGWSPRSDELDSPEEEKTGETYWVWEDHVLHLYCWPSHLSLWDGVKLRKESYPALWDLGSLEAADEYRAIVAEKT